MTTIEIVAAVFGLLCVWLTSRENIWSFPVGIVNSALFFYMFLDIKLYADMSLQIVFILLSMYGWKVWLSGDRNTKGVTTTRNITRREAGLAVGIWALLSAGFTAIFTNFTDAAVPYIDVPLAVASVMGQWFLSKKVIQSWWIWIAVDVFSIGMYGYKELYITAGLYAIFLVLAIKGYLDWRNEKNFKDSIGLSDNVPTPRSAFDYSVG